MHRSRAAYRVLRDQLLPILTARRHDSERDVVSPSDDVAFAPQRRRPPSSHLALVVGHFSFSDWYATFGDTEAMRVVSSWLNDANVPFDVACHPVNGFPGVDFWKVDPAVYTIVIFVCGPWTQDRRDVVLKRFPHCVKIGVNLSVVSPEEHGFDFLFARDRLDVHEPDLVIASNDDGDLPLAGLFMVHDQPEYGERQRHGVVERAIDKYLERDEVLAVPLDTIHLDNGTSARSARQLTSMLRRLDLVLTTRLHGFVFSLKAGTPAIAIDPVSGGGKVAAQAAAVGWPLVINCDEVTPDLIGDAVRRCLDGSIGDLVQGSLAVARTRVAGIKADFVSVVSQLGVPDASSSSQG